MHHANAGGPAFPVAIPSEEGGTCTWIGITARDYFAAQAMAALAPSLNRDACKMIAVAAYAMADAMLAERNRERTS